MTIMMHMLLHHATAHRQDAARDSTDSTPETELGILTQLLTNLSPPYPAAPPGQLVADDSQHENNSNKIHTL